MADLDLDIVKSVFDGAEKLTSTFGQAADTSDIESRSITPFPLIPINAHIIDGLDDDSERSPLAKGWSIFKVPRHFREVNEGGYEPRIVSIGPFHYKRPGLEHMEAQKSRIVNKYLTAPGGTTAIEEAMKILEEETRGCYSEDFKDIDSESFTRMMLVDGCFVVYLLRLGGASYKGKLADDPIFTTQWMPLNIGRDLLLLENQLPLFVLEKIFDLTTSYWSEEKITLNELALQFFEPLRPGKDKIPTDEALTKRQARFLIKYPHLLSLFQSSCAPWPNGYQHNQKKKGNIITTSTTIGPCNAFTGKGWTYGAKWLSNAGIIFINKSGNVLDIETGNNGRTLLIPTLYLNGNTISVLRNLVAYEQCDKCAEPYFTSHAFFFSNILGNVEDAAVLRKRGIIRQAQGGDDGQVVTFFNNLAKELVFDMNKCCLANIIKYIQTYSQRLYAKMRFTAQAILPRISLMEIVLGVTSILQVLFFVTTNFTPPAAAPSPTPSPSPSG